MNDEQLEVLHECLDIAQRCEVNSWVGLKKILLLTLPSEARKQFSTRDPYTKKHTVNDFERDVVDIYYKKTGVKLRLPHEE